MKKQIITRNTKEKLCVLKAKKGIFIDNLNPYVYGDPGTDFMFVCDMDPPHSTFGEFKKSNLIYLYCYDHQLRLNTKVNSWSCKSIDILVSWDETILPIAGKNEAK